MEIRYNDNMTRTKKIVILLFAGLVVVISFLTLTSANSRSVIEGDLGKKLKIITNNQIDFSKIDDKSLIIDDKSRYYLFTSLEQSEQDLPKDLWSWLAKDMSDYQSLYEVNSPTCDKNKEWAIGDFEFNSKAVDLNTDGNSEFIVMPWKICGNINVRGASGNGPIYVVGKGKEDWEIVGYLEGNGYVLTENKTSGYRDIMTNFHSSAASGSETIYRWKTKDENYGQASYEPIFAKWYRFPM